MQKVSKAYKESMKSSLRERAFIMLSFGLVNQEAQAKATVDDGDFLYYSNKSNLLGEHGDDTVYATLEENFTRVDGSMFFPPKEGFSTSFYDTGVISDKLLSDAIFELTISLNTIPVDFRGMTLNFGENYPVDFDVIGSTGQIVEFRNNDQSLWNTEEVFRSTTSIRFVFYRMKNEHSRLRVYSIRFGYGLVYYNDSVMDSKLETYVSPIGADVPQIDFTVQLKNYDHYFNVDNPTSAINYLETGQEMDIMYGYQLPDSDEIEWVQGGHLLCSEWESDDHTATIRCQDIFRNMDSEFIKGMFSSSGKSYYSLAQDILRDAGITDYYLDPRLKNLYTNNPMPRVKHKEALQIIANACRCTLDQNRFGSIRIKSNFMPEAHATTNGQTSFSNVAAIVNDSEKIEYGMLTADYTPVNGGTYFLPADGKNRLNTGYVSKDISSDDCLFDVNPVVTISLDAIRAYHSVSFVFGHCVPSEFIIHTYNDGAKVEDYVVTADEIDRTMTLIHSFDDFNTMELEFTKTAIPNNRIVLNQFSLSEVTDYTMTRKDMTCSPKAIKQELIKEVIVPCYLYQPGLREENLVNEEVEVEEGQIETYYIQDASYNYRVLMSEVEGRAEIVDWGNYYVTLRFKVTGAYRLEVQGYRYRIVEKYATKTLNVRGKTVRWKNPLISDMSMAKDLCEWLADYYTAGIEYEYTTRGNPELDATDIVYQENEFREDMKVNIYRHTIEFKQSFSGKITARRIGG